MLKLDLNLNQFLNLTPMKNLIVPLYSWSNGAIIMTIVFGLVILALVGAVFFMMNNNEKKD